LWLTGKVETITNVGVFVSTWFNGGRKIVESGEFQFEVHQLKMTICVTDLFSNLIASPSKDTVYIINTQTRNVTCEIGKLESPSELILI
jgi:hypothetical protein